MVEGLVQAEPIAALALKGFHRPVPTLNVIRLRDGESTNGGVT
jgi:hypothetical protein